MSCRGIREYRAGIRPKDRTERCRHQHGSHRLNHGLPQGRGYDDTTDRDPSPNLLLSRSTNELRQGPLPFSCIHPLNPDLRWREVPHSRASQLTSAAKPGRRGSLDSKRVKRVGCEHPYYGLQTPSYGLLRCYHHVHPFTRIHHMRLSCLNHPHPRMTPIEHTRQRTDLWTSRNAESERVMVRDLANGGGYWALGVLGTINR